MSESFDLQAYLSKGIEDFMKDLLKATLTNPRGSAFMLRFAAATAAAEIFTGTGAEEADLAALFQGQDVFLVLQQHHACLCGIFR